MLEAGKRDHLTEAMWAAIGGAVSAAPAAYSDLHAAYWSEPAARVHLSGFGLIEVIIFIAACAAAIVMIAVVFARGKHSRDLGAEIRDRTARR